MGSSRRLSSYSFTVILGSDPIGRRAVTRPGEGVVWAALHPLQLSSFRPHCAHLDRHMLNRPARPKNLYVHRGQSVVSSPALLINITPEITHIMKVIKIAKSVSELANTPTMTPTAPPIVIHPNAHSAKMPIVFRFISRISASSEPNWLRPFCSSSSINI